LVLPRLRYFSAAPAVKDETNVFRMAIAVRADHTLQGRIVGNVRSPCQSSPPLTQALSVSRSKTQHPPAPHLRCAAGAGVRSACTVPQAHVGRCTGRSSRCTPRAPALGQPLAGVVKEREGPGTPPCRFIGPRSPKTYIPILELQARSTAVRNWPCRRRGPTTFTATSSAVGPSLLSRQASPDRPSPILRPGGPGEPS
jgi:hypothetical protein